MKNILPLFIVVYLLAVCSCQHRQSYPPQFLVADSLASVQPDSAIALLESLKAESLQWDKATQMYYSLLTIKAQDKAYISQTSDSLMLSVLHYYEHGGDKRLLPEAYYYMGSTYRDLGDAPRALEYYQKALEVLPEGASPLRRYVNNQMGWLFYRQKLYDEALSCYQNSFTNDSILDDKAEMASDLVNIGVVYSSKGALTHTLDLYKKAKKLLSYQVDSVVTDEIDTQTAGLLIELGRHEEALKIIQKPLSHVNRSNISSVYSIAAKAYYHTGYVDTASYYFNKLLSVGNIYGKRAAYEFLCDIALKKGQMSEASHYMSQFRIIADSVQNINASESLAQITSLYNYQKILEEKEIINKRNNINRGIIFFLVLSLIIVLWCFLRYYVKLKQSRDAMQMKIDEIKDTQEKMQNTAERIIANKDDIISNLELQKNYLDEANSALKKQIDEQKALIQGQIAEIQEKIEHKNYIDEKLNKSEIHSRLIYLINNKKHMGQKDLDKLFATYQTVAPDFLEKLTSLCKMSPLEKEITLLIRMGISPIDIASLTNYSKQHISGIRKGLYKRAKDIDASPSKWDELVFLL